MSGRKDYLTPISRERRLMLSDGLSRDPPLHLIPGHNVPFLQSLDGEQLPTGPELGEQHL